MTILRIFLFALSSLGSFELLRLILKDRVTIYWLPSLTIAIQVTVLFFAGLLNLLPEAAWGLYLLGFGGLIYRLYRCRIPHEVSSGGGKRFFLAEYLNPGYIVLLIALGAVAVYVRGKLFTDNDNFTHWAVVVQQMLKNNRFPNFQDTLIRFQEYPLGSSVYIYFFAKMISTEEPIQMLAQLYAVSAAILPLFTFVTKNKFFSSVGILSFFYFAFVYNIFVTELLVDTLLPAVGCCGLLFAILYCKRGCGKMPLWCAAIYMIQVIQIKNSGIFFALLIAIVILYQAEKGQDRLRRIPSILFSLSSLLLWQKHCTYVFSSTSAMTKHAMTAENYLAVVSTKSTAELLKTCSIFLKFALSWKDIWAAIVLYAVLGCLICIWGRELRKCYRTVLLSAVSLYIVYQAGELAMYLFSMPTPEALDLDCSVRYSKTILFAIIYLGMIPALRLMSSLPASKIPRFLISASMPLCILLFLHTVNVRLVPSYTFKRRIWMDRAICEYKIPDNDAYAIICDPKDKGYCYFLARYLLHSEDRYLLVETGQLNSTVIPNYYIFVKNPENEIVQDWVRANFPDQVGRHLILQ